MINPEAGLRIILDFRPLEFRPIYQDSHYLVRFLNCTKLGIAQIETALTEESLKL